MAHSTIDSSSHFTGERVIPGEVEPDLWNEHISRYRYASLLCAGKGVLDVGCGTGYGTALLADAGAEAVGFDNSEEALEYAQQHYGGQARFMAGSASTFPASNHSFDVVTAFEVIEHVEDWANLIQEAARVLRDDGLFLVSTPNKVYYTETRQDVGPNPFHVHEFEYHEFKDALCAVFPHVQLLVQNRQEAFVFVGEESARDGKSYTATAPIPSQAHFFLAICSKQPAVAPAFTYVTGTGNLLRERELYIRALREQVEGSRRQHLTLLSVHERLEQELRDQNSWAQSLEQDLETARELLAAEQANTAAVATAYQEQLDKAHLNAHEKTDWALDLERQLAAKSDDLLHALHLLDDAHRDAEEKAKWGFGLDAQFAAKSEDLLRTLELLDQAYRDLEERTRWAQGLDVLVQERTDWAQSLERELEHSRQAAASEKLPFGDAQLARQMPLKDREQELDRLDKNLIGELETRKLTAEGWNERSKTTDTIAGKLIRERHAIKNSKWLKLGRTLGLGPNLDNDPL